jgi:hypothetical protein
MLINMLSIEPAARRYGSDPPNQPWQGPGIWDGMIFPKIVITTVRKTVKFFSGYSGLAGASGVGRKHIQY